MKIYLNMEIELAIDGDYLPEDEGITSPNVLPENCYPGSAAEYEITSVRIKTPTGMVPCPIAIIDMIDEEEVLRLANQKYTEEYDV